MKSMRRRGHTFQSESQFSSVYLHDVSGTELCKLRKNPCTVFAEVLHFKPCSQSFLSGQFLSSCAEFTAPSSFFFPLDDFKLVTKGKKH